MRFVKRWKCVRNGRLACDCCPWSNTPRGASDLVIAPAPVSSSDVHSVPMNKGVFHATTASSWYCNRCSACSGSWGSRQDRRHCRDRRYCRYCWDCRYRCDSRNRWHHRYCWHRRHCRHRRHRRSHVSHPAHRTRSRRKRMMWAVLMRLGLRLGRGPLVYSGRKRTRDKIGIDLSTAPRGMG